MRELADARNTAESLLYQTEKTLADHGEAVDAETASAIEAKAAELKAVLDSEDAAAIRTKTEELMQSSHQLAQAVYEQAQQAQTASAPTSNGGSDDEVVEEGEYEIIDEEKQ